MNPTTPEERVRRGRSWRESLLALALILGLSVGAGVVLGGCNAEMASAKAEEDEEEDSEDEAVPVEVAALERGSIEAVLRFSTNLEAETEVEVYSESARRVVALNVEEGYEVRKGRTLLRLEDDEQRTTLAKVESEADKVQREFERIQRLHGKGLVSDEALNQSTFDAEQTALRLEEARRELSYTQVRAPISGVVTQRYVSLGDYVTPNQHLFDIVDFDSIVARVFVPERELGRLSVGQEARVTVAALGGAAFQGEIDRIAPVVDPKSGTVKVTIALPRQEGLRPGLYVDAQLVTATHDDALLIPKRALVYDQDQVFVYRMSENDGAGTVERLRLVPELQNKAFVKPGPESAELQMGDRLVIAGQAGLKDGAAVRLVGAALEATAVTADAAPSETPEASDAAAR